MFHNLTPRAQQVFVLAKSMALKLQQNYLGTEHLLLGLLELKQSIAVRVLQRMGLDVETVHDALQKHMVAGKHLVEGVVHQDGSIPTTDIPLTPRVRQVLGLAEKVAHELNHPYVGTEHLLLGILEEGDGLGAKILKTLDIDPEECRKEILSELAPDNVEDNEDGEDVDEDEEDKGIVDNLYGTRLSLGKTYTLRNFGIDLTAKAKENQLDPVIGRNKEIDSVIQILCRRTKHNPVLIGEAGVGKTAVVEGLSQRIVQGEVPEALLGKRVFILDLALMLSGTKYRGQFEERLKNVMNEVKESKNIILFLDELHTIVGAGSSEGSMDASNILKPALARGDVQCIGATTLDEYRQHVEKDTALNRRFQAVLIEPSSVQDTVEILRGLKSYYEKFHNVHLSDGVIRKAVSLTDRYVANRFFPDKAIDLIDEAGARARMKAVKQTFSTKDIDDALKDAILKKSAAIKSQKFEEAARWRDEEQALKREKETKMETWRQACHAHAVEVKEDLLQKIIFDWTGIPLDWMGVKETKHCLNLDKALNRQIIGQEEAVNVVCRALKRSKVDMRDPIKPTGSFLFLGPTGVGKTHLVKVLAEQIFGDRNAIVQIDMSEYMEKHTVARLIGSPPGYVGYGEGGQLTEAIRRKPYSIILFDEIEKAHPDVTHILLQVLEEGKLTDSVGRTVDFRNTILVMTSNVGAEALQKTMGLGFNIPSKAIAFEQLKEKVQEASKSAFKPEFLNRISDIVVFRPLEREHIQKVVDIEIKKIAVRLQEKGIELFLSTDAKQFLVVKGFDDKYGARPLKRAIERYVEDVLADALLEHKVKLGQKVIFDVDTQKDCLNFITTKVKKLADYGKHVIK
ncbi:MAG: ATP-dependent Clp protease ATP-binding subunit [Puniceicoccales bacterium]|jgi:ATP-dependent Clp protease ATP-binding subunit ClpC|nr:ATP-dependent Clp protease ATP-binding subunit [Puniceicoccales bacterium]